MDDSSYWKVSLRLRHPSMTAFEINKHIGLKPRSEHTVGEDRVAVFSKRREKIGGQYKNTFCSYPLKDISSAAELAWAIEDNLDYLLERRQFWDSFMSSGGSADYFVGIFVYSNFGETLNMIFY